ncbi:MAG: hypothetical protein EKK64_00485 [Neisseriaceae bacterium]|nr:MAG: hypothetical protein EKK64_00485 [Neisseriaceae bacterium]
MKKEIVEEIVDGQRYWKEITVKWYKELNVGDLKEPYYEFRNKDEPVENFRSGSGWGAVVQENNNQYRVPCNSPKAN